MDAQGILLADEINLRNNGDYENPNLQAFIDNDENYLGDSLRIDKYVKNFVDPLT